MKKLCNAGAITVYGTAGDSTSCYYMSTAVNRCFGYICDCCSLHLSSYLVQDTKAAQKEVALDCCRVNTIPYILCTYIHGSFDSRPGVVKKPSLGRNSTSQSHRVPSQVSITRQVLDVLIVLFSKMVGGQGMSQPWFAVFLPRGVCVVIPSKLDTRPCVQAHQLGLVTQEKHQYRNFFLLRVQQYNSIHQ